MLEIAIILSCLFILVGVGVGWWIIDGIPRAQANAMQEKFGSLGDLRGKSLKQIVAVVGRPSARAVIADSKMTYSWRTQKYFVTLMFDGDVCEGVESEIVL